MPSYLFSVLQIESGIERVKPIVTCHYGSPSKEYTHNSEERTILLISRRSLVIGYPCATAIVVFRMVKMYNNSRISYLAAEFDLISGKNALAVKILMT